MYYGDLNKVSDLLDVDETVIWQGRPNYTVWALSRILVPSVVLLPLFFLLMHGIIFSRINILLIFMIFVSFFMLLLLWEYFLVFSKKGFPDYYITSNSRVIILSKLGSIKSPFMGNELVFSHENIRSIYTEQNIIEKMFGIKCKSIIFRLGYPLIATTRSPELRTEVSASSAGDNNELRSNLPHTGSIKKFITGVDASTQSVALAQLGKEVAFTSVDDFERVISIINNKSICKTKVNWESRSSRGGLLIYAFLKDIFRLPRILLFSSVIIGFILAGIYFLAGSEELFLSVVSYYLPRLFVGVLVIFCMTSYSSRVIFGFISPKYQIADNSLRIQEKGYRFISDIPFENIELEKIKHIWRIKLPGDIKDSFLLGVELDPVGPQRSNRRDSLISKGLKLWGGSLSYRVVVSISDSDGFIKLIGQKPQEIRQDIFEKILFYSSI